MNLFIKNKKEEKEQEVKEGERKRGNARHREKEIKTTKFSMDGSSSGARRMLFRKSIKFA